MVCMFTIAALGQLKQNKQKFKVSLATQYAGDHPRTHENLFLKTKNKQRLEITNESKTMKKMES